MKNHDETVRINQNPNWSCISKHCYGILIIGSFIFNALLNLIKDQQPYADEIQL